MLSPIEEIKSRLDIVELIQSYLRLQKAGANFKALCPFHSEKTPSFNVSPSRQIWHCFGCGKGGDVFKFVMEIEGHDFPEALRMLAQRAGVVLKREDPSIRSERNRLYDLCEEAAKMFAETLLQTSAAKSYLFKRGVSDQTVKQFRIGFAPQAWDYLLKSLARKGFAKEEAEKAGLAIKSEDKSSWYDRFRSRLMFPISDGNGRVIGFGGRIFEPETGNRKHETAQEAKYINTPNTLIYDKSRVLYGFDKAKETIRKKNQVVIVEGYMDCIMSHQAGVKNTIAVSGTALTPPQLKQLKNLCNVIIATFDRDDAGEMATSRSLTLAAGDFERFAAVIPKGKDVADLVLENPQLWRDAAEKNQPFVEYFMDRAFGKFNSKTLDGRKQILSHVLPELRRLTNAVDASYWTKILAARIDAKEETIWENLNRVANPDLSGKQSNNPEPSVKNSRRDLLEERLLMLLTALRSEDRQLLISGREFAFSSAQNESIFQILQSDVAGKPTDELKSALDMFKFRGEILIAELSDAKEEFQICARELEKARIRERLNQIEMEIGKKEREGNIDAVSALLKDFNFISNQLKNLS